MALQAAGRIPPDSVDARALQERLGILRAREDLDRLSRRAVQALSGEAALAIGDSATARSILQALSEEAGWSPGSGKADPAPLLRARLMPDPAARREALATAAARPDADPRLTAELALYDMDAGNHRNALARFDAALPRMGKALRGLYAPFAAEAQAKADLVSRQDAGAPGAAILRLSSLKETTYGDLARALFNLRPSLFDPSIRSKQSPSTEELVLDLAASGIYPSGAGSGGRPRASPATPGAGLPAIGEIVTRREAASAFFVLHQALATRPIASDRYTKRYQTPGLPGFGKSPVPDLAFGSPGFDACLATVELEVLDLPDGKNFQPESPISGMDAATALKKLGL